MRGRTSETAFWVVLGVFGALIGLITLRTIGSTSLAAIVLQTAGVLWIVALLLRAFRQRFPYAAAGAWVVLLWLPMCVLVVRRLHYWVTIGMEPPDGMGSPMAFLFGFVFEWIVFLPLTVLLAYLVLAKPWRAARRVLHNTG